MSQITDPVIKENSKELEVPDFNKKEVEGIAEKVAKENCLTKVNFNNLAEGCVGIAVTLTSLEECLEKGLLPGGAEESLTDAQLQRLVEILKKAISDGKVYMINNDAICFINYVQITSTDIIACFGCTVSGTGSAHDATGAHLEFD